MKVLKAIALLLHYPDDTVREHADELLALILQEQRLTDATRLDLKSFIHTLQHNDLLDLQADYVALFDRGRALSLHLFEHVHGESRDRGQAMVELSTIYQQHGFEISANELPDYVPLFLEFCSLLDGAEVQERLSEIEHLLQVLHSRLDVRNSAYAVLFKALLEIGELSAAGESLRHKVQTEQRDDTPQALDQVWAEAPVTFGSSDGCNGAQTHKGQAVPIDTSGLQPGCN